MNLYDETCFECSKIITQRYSTSFSQGIKAFDKRFRYPVYAIYAFVRYADEIVDTFDDHDQPLLIQKFKQDTYDAIAQQISLNPILHAFQQIVHQYAIGTDLIESFFRSMEMDLKKKNYDVEGYNDYIHGSAEVVGLMCLCVFCENDAQLYQQLKNGARSLGSALQKINFLRDVKADYEERGRTYFPGVDLDNFTDDVKKIVQADIKNDFDIGFKSIKQLPRGARLGVYIAYAYYLQLFKKISRIPAGKILQKRIRISNTQKLALYLKAVLKQKLNAI